MNLFNKFLFYISVPKCVSCGQKLDIEDCGICKFCLKVYDNHKKRNCSICSKTLSRCTCSNEYLKTHGVKKLIKVYRYINREERILPSNNLLYSLKRDNRRDVLNFLKYELITAINENIKLDKSYIITSVPRRDKSIKKYGYDHAEKLASSVAKHFDVPYKQFLKSTAEQAQKKTLRANRSLNATFDYKGDFNLKNKKILIIDDIVTTGSSLGNCALLIKGLNAKEIIGATLAIAYKDEETIYN